MPRFRQLFVTPAPAASSHGLERLAFCLRKRAEREADVYFASLSSRTIVYKGMLTTGQLESFFPDLSDDRYASELAVVHSRFSTNTFPSWPLAHPYRFIAHKRRDQHGQGQPQLDGARGEPAAQRRDPGRPRRGCSRSAPRAQRLGELRRGARAAAHGRAARCRTRCS
jgi:hypothetical protein